MKSNGKDLPAATSRSGHGAASVIPHLNNVIPLEPSHLRDAWPEERVPAGGPVDGAQDATATTD